MPTVDVGRILELDRLLTAMRNPPGAESLPTLTAIAEELLREERGDTRLRTYMERQNTLEVFLICRGIVRARRARYIGRFSGEACFNCTLARASIEREEQGLRSLRAERPSDPGGEPVMWLCRRCRLSITRRRNRGTLPADARRLRDFRDAVARRYPDAEIVSYSRSGANIRRGVVAIRDDE